MRNISRNEIEILKANLGDKIKTITDMIDCITIVLPLIGIKELPDKLSMKHCWDALDHFRTFTKSNFIQAFQFNEAMVYETRIEHFNAFLPAYMSQVLNLYRSMKNNAQMEYLRALKAIEPKEEPITAEQVYTGLIGYVKENNEIPRFWNWNDAFMHMEETGILKMTLAEKNELYKKVVSEIEMRKKSAANLNELKDINKILLPENVIKECRRIAVSNYLQRTFNVSRKIKLNI